MENAVMLLKSSLRRVQLRRKPVFLLLFSACFTFALICSYALYPAQFSGISAAYQRHMHPGPYKAERAIGTFLAAPFNIKPDDSDDDDNYFVAARTLLYQLLHAPKTKLQTPIPVVILVAKAVRESKRQRLRDDGAIIVEVEEVGYDIDSIDILTDRWADTFTKLRLFDPNVMPYKTVLLMDTDLVLQRPLDSIFASVAAPMQTMNGTGNVTEELGKLPEDFLMLASPETLDTQHSYPYHDPKREKTIFNSGLLVYSPNADLFHHYLEILKRPNLYYNGSPDQNLLNYAHRWGGPMPWRRLDPSWYLNWPNDNDLNGGMPVLHSKWWDEPGFEIMVSDAVRRYALARRWEMEGYWRGKEGFK